MVCGGRAGWDFSDSRVDLYQGHLIVYVVDPPIGYLLALERSRSTHFRYLIRDSLSLLGHHQYIQDLPALLGHTYVVRTAEHHYAKFKILYLLPVPFIQYVYQSDGSRILDSDVTAYRIPRVPGAKLRPIQRLMQVPANTRMKPSPRAACAACSQNPHENGLKTPHY